MSVSQIKSSKRGTAAHGAIRGSDSGRATPGIPGTVSPGISLACAPDDLVSKIVVAGGGTRFHSAVAQDNRSMTNIGSRSDVDAGTAQRKSVEVVFYKEILDHFGFPHQCELMRVSTVQPTGEAAIRDAVQQFEQVKKVNNWRLAADRYKVLSALSLDI